MEHTDSSGTLKSSEMQSLAFCIVSTQAGRRQGSERRAGAVISPPSGRLGRDGRQDSGACCLHPRGGVFLCFLAEDVFSCPSLHTRSRRQSSPVGSVFGLLIQLLSGSNPQTFEVFLLSVKQSGTAGLVVTLNPNSCSKCLYLPRKD